MTRPRWSAAVVGLVSVCLLGSGPAALAATSPGNPSWSGQAQDDWIAVEGSSGSQASGGPSAADGPWTVVMYLPACAGNDPNSPTSDDTLCAQAVQMCQATPPPDDLMFWRYTALREADGSRTPWVTVGQVCLRPQDVPTGDVPAFSVADFRRLPLPPGVVKIQPASGRTLVNVDTNVMVVAGQITLTTAMLGLPIRVRATPARYEWAFGDGETLLTQDPGGAWPDMTTTHVYSAAGPRQIQLTTHYTGEYSVAGGPWLPVDGEAAVASVPVPVEVFEARAELVHDLVTP